MSSLAFQLEKVEDYRKALEVKGNIETLVQSSDISEHSKKPLRILLRGFSGANPLSSSTFVLLGELWVRTARAKLLEKAQKVQREKEAREARAKALAIYPMLEGYTLGQKDLDNRLNVVKIAFKNYLDGKKPVENPHSVKECVVEPTEFLMEVSRIMGGFDHLRKLYLLKNKKSDAKASLAKAA
ncbi:hypothetical protein [Pseudodesulfovibrio pelocollis]|uniref:hypothetical protein n=1 Tax=Pseudodesulfovibrio pelocollis TaxID=3051432 RepID=UPI00255A800F|nr:hypothetical protein [Pseudodesulfovibrio sp. SB368]